MNTFVWVRSEDDMLFVLNLAFIESVDRVEPYTEVHMISGRMIRIQQTLIELMQMVPA